VHLDTCGLEFFPGMTLCERSHEKGVNLQTHEPRQIVGGLVGTWNSWLFSNTKYWNEFGDPYLWVSHVTENHHSPLIQKTESPPTFMFSRITRTLDGSEWLKHSYIRWFGAFLFLEDVKSKIRLTGKSPDFIEDTPSSGCVFSIVILVFGGSNWKTQL